MAPQASVIGSAITSSAFSTSSPADSSSKPWVPIPVALLIFLGVCLAYTLSYILYRFVMSRRRASEEDIPECPDRGVSQFMNGARLTLNFGHKSTPSTPAVSLNMPEDEKPLTAPSNHAHSEIPTSSPAGSSSTPFIILTPSLTLPPDDEIGEARLQEQGPPEPESTISAPAQQPLSRRIVAKVKFLSRDRAEAIALDPKLAPVQGPLRPLSMVPSPPHKKRALFGLGFKHLRAPAEEPETDSQVQ